ncbi:MAG: amidophosphoribosyltransferase [Selenomonadaceae bacterium]|nr:amidophosphoribosyltransferase [Selenomonadaceae bacterium]
MDFGATDYSFGEDCGVFGMYDLGGGDVATTIYYGLYALQHRGQESAGIAVTNTFDDVDKVFCHKDLGRVNKVFNEENISRLKGNLGVGHVRYSTAGASTRENSQPLVLAYIKGTLVLAHNGNLTNAPKLRRELAMGGAIFQTTTDSETIAYHIARERIHSKTAQEATVKALRKVQGSYSLVVASPRKLIGARDPWGFRPLVIGKLDNAYIITSETCALETINAEFVRDVLPGEVVTISSDGKIESNLELALPEDKTARCIFEYIYFCRPDTTFDRMSVTKSRIIAGKILAKTHPVEADLVVGVPESGNMAAVGYSMESGIPYGIAFTKNTYVGRTFIKPKQSSRVKSVQVKLNALREVVAGKKIIIIDDSIVRGTTSNQIVEMLRNAGAKEIHMRVSAPPFYHPCYFGIDIPDENQLIANGRTVEEICKIIGADSLGYLPLEALKEMSGGLPICDACFSGNYPIAPPNEDIRGEFDK